MLPGFRSRWSKPDLVRGGQSFEGLPGEHPEVFQREGAARDHGLQRLAVHQFHDDVGSEHVRAEVVHRDHVGMLHRREVDGLAPGAFVQAAPGDLSFGFRQPLERDTALQPLVERQENLAQPTLSQDSARCGSGWGWWRAISSGRFGGRSGWRGQEPPHTLPQKQDVCLRAAGEIKLARRLEGEHAWTVVPVEVDGLGTLGNAPQVAAAQPEAPVEEASVDPAARVDGHGAPAGGEQAAAPIVRQPVQLVEVAALGVVVFVQVQGQVEACLAGGVSARRGERDRRGRRGG